ncbi:hypothetical protein HMN09_00869500 [Mycena chlorophos]|uniref:Uncharacterized protein n=1 Tax=Mycena chlorophos TaxID=658473 RepID=A0A8H6SN46_MYCCL|nr:hypothetical protein HMN09_00869500 [Mycena chlorophos]
MARTTTQPPPGPVPSSSTGMSSKGGKARATAPESRHDQSAKKVARKQTEATRMLFPEYRTFDDKPPKRGTMVEGKGPTPLYALAWRFNPLALLPGPSGGSLTALESDFITRWAESFRTKADRQRIDQIYRPLVLESLDGYRDYYVYYIAASNADDPAKITLGDVKFAKRALPPKFVPEANVDVDSDGVFGWFRTDK